jgi:hypothetical protein
MVGAWATLIVASSLLFWRYDAVTTEYAEFRATVQAEGARKQKEEDAREAAWKAQQETALTRVKEDYENRIKDAKVVADRALANYRKLRDSGSGSGGVRRDGAAGGNAVDDGTLQKPLFARTLANCAEDALKLQAWQAWCEGIKCPVTGDGRQETGNR